MDFTRTINGNTMEYRDEGHEYYVDGIRVPSITEMLKVKYGEKYAGVSEATLKRAADAGTAMHEAVQSYVIFGDDDGSEELRNFRFLLKQYEMKAVASEVPVILYEAIDDPIAAGRLDLVLEKDGNLGLGDLKRTSTLDREYLTYQLNLYKIAYEQTYHQKVEFLAGIHLRGEKRKLVTLPMNYKYADEIITKWKEKNQ